MTPIELRQKLHHQLDQLPPEELSLVDDFLASLESALHPHEPVTADCSDLNGTQESVSFSDFLAKLKKQPLRRAELIRPRLTGKDLLPVVGSWQGDDIEECLEILHQTRSQSEF
jgi:hypothetical protein